MSLHSEEIAAPSETQGHSGLLRGLNAEQRAAVTLPPEPALILAGAGSGKTRVLTTRIAWLLTTGQVSPAGVMAVTFTNKAAREMLARLSAMLPIPVRGMWIGTFHGLCNRFLRTHWKLSGLPQSFQILDMQDQLASVKRIVKAMNLDEERYVPKQVSAFIAGAKDDGKRPRDIAVRDEHTRRLAEIYQAYEEQCQREGSVDFAELLLRTYELMRDNDALREHYRRRFRHILVDEFQDTNRLQYQWLRMFASSGDAADGLPPTSVLAVGDDDQSIYAFRGALVGNMADFQRDFGVRHLIRLEQNYRSSSHILDTANALIARNTRRLGKQLRTDAGAGEPVRVFEATSDFGEAQWVLDEAQQLHREGTPRAEIALLYRSNAQSRVLESALFNAGVPYRVYGGLRFFERAEVKHALAYLRLIENANDDTSFLRVVNFPARGIGARSIEQLQDAAKASKVSLYGTAKQGGKAAAFAALVDKLKAACDGLTLPETVEQVLELSGLRAHYRTEKEGQDRLANLDELVNAAESFVAEEGHVDAEGELSGELAAFLAHASLEAGEHQAGEGDDALQLMTVHSAKGLEFDVVFISGLEEGLFPHENSVREDKGLEEERRLMYVAVTRARKRLYVSHAQTRMLHGQTRYNLPSRFFDEIPEELLKWLTPKLARGHAAVPGRLTFSAPGRPAWAAPPPAAVMRRTAEKEAGGFRIGQNVQHAKFGQGVIVNAEGAGSDARVQVNFGREGVKWLALSVAKLTPA